MFPPADDNLPPDASDNSQSYGGPAVEERRPHEGLIPIQPTTIGPSSGVPWGFGMPTRPEILTAKPDFGGLMHSLRRRKWLAMFLGLICGAGLGAAAWFLLPARSETSSLLFVRSQQPHLLIPTELPVDAESFKKNQIALLKSPMIAEAALNDSVVQALPIVKKHGFDASDWLADTLKVDNYGGGEVLRVSLAADTQYGLDQIVNGVVQTYMHDVVEKDRTQQLDRRDKLQTKLAAYTNELRAKRLESFNLSKQLGSSDPNTISITHKVEVDYLDELLRERTKVAEAITDVNLQEAILEAESKASKTPGFSTEEAQTMIENNPQVVSLNNQLAQIQSNLSQMVPMVVHPNNDPGVRQLRLQYASTQRQLEQAKSQLLQAYSRGMQEKGQVGSIDKTELKIKLDLLMQSSKQIAEKIRDQSEHVRTMEQFSGDLDAVRGEIGRLLVLVNDLSGTLSHWNIELEAPARVDLAEPASKARAKEPIRQYLMAGFGGVAGFGVALLGVAFLEFLGRRLNSSHEVTDGLGITVMGDLPTLRTRALTSRKRKAIHSLVAESINGIRAALFRNSEPGVCNTFLVTSADEQEGKTTVASQLAASLARSGRRTLLIDCDLRHPGAHHVFNLTNDFGFCEMLRGDVAVEDAIRATPADQLWMITAGKCCQRAVMGLGKDVMGDIFAELESRFDFIIVDTGPVLKVADALLLGQYVDGAILSVLRDVSKINKVYEANERLKLVGVKVLGAVINGSGKHGSMDRYHVVEASAA